MKETKKHINRKIITISVESKSKLATGDRANKKEQKVGRAGLFLPIFCCGYMITAEFLWLRPI